MKTFIGGLIGFIIGFLIWFPYGIMYTVQANKDSALLKVLSLMKGLMEL